MKKKRALSDSRNPDIQTWTVSVEEDPETGDLILPLPEDLLELQGWQTGDTLTWDQREDGAWQLSKKETEMKTKDGKDRFDLENEIMHVWSIKDHVENIIWKQFDSPCTLQSEDSLHNQLAAVATMLDLHCDKLMDTFCQVFQLNEYATDEMKELRRKIMEGHLAFPAKEQEPEPAVKKSSKKAPAKKAAKK